MKINKLFSAALIGLMALSVTSCDGTDEPLYQPAETPTENQRVYFAKASMTQIVAPEANSFDVNIYRPENQDAQELTVKLIFSDESGLFSIPESVTFPAGVSYAVVPVSYDTNLMTPNEVYPTSIAIEEAYANEYSIATISVGINYEVMTDWVAFGTSEDDPKKTGLGVWKLGGYWSGNAFSDVRVMSRYIPSDPNIMEFTVQIWDGEDGTTPDVTLALDDALWFTAFTFKTSDGGETLEVPYQDFVLAGDGYGMATGHTLLPDYFGPASYWDEVTGTFVLDICYTKGSSAYAPGPDTIVMEGYADLNDYTVSITSSGQVKIDGKDYAVVNFDYDPEVVAAVVYTVVELAEEETELAEDQIAAIAEAIVDPAQELYTLASIEEPGNVTFNFPSSGNFAIVAVPYNVDYAPKAACVGYFSYETFNPYLGWTEVGTAKFTNTILPTLFGGQVPVEDYTVTISQYDEEPSLYRINMPFAQASYMDAIGTVASFGSIEFVVADETHVYFPFSATDYLYQGEAVGILSYAYYAMANGTAASDIPAAYFGTYKDGVVTMPAIGSKPTNFLYAIGEDGYYYLDVDFTLDLNADQVAAPARKNISGVNNFLNAQRAVSKTLFCPTFFSSKAMPVEKTVRGALKANANAVAL